MIGGSRPARVPPPNPHHVAQQLQRRAGIDVTLVLEQDVDQRPPPVPKGELQQAVRLHRPQRAVDEGAGQQAGGRVGEQRGQVRRQGVADQPVGALRALGQRPEERIVGLGGNGHGTRESSHRLPLGRQHRSQPSHSLTVQHADSTMTCPRIKVRQTIRPSGLDG